MNNTEMKRWKKNALKEFSGCVEATPLQLSFVFLSVAVFPVLPFLSASASEVDSPHQARTQARDFPLASPSKEELVIQAKKWVVSPGDGGMRGGKESYFVLPTETNVVFAWVEKRTGRLPLKEVKKRCYRTLVIECTCAFKSQTLLKNIC